ncbi:glycoside hydrolase superfamily [Cyathus striatus]|nr:glycoside hydrolase superfamily [Cyathus striatus]
MLRSLLLIPAYIAAAYALVHGVDSSQLVSTATYTKAKGEGFTKAIIRGYQEACGDGGRVDPNFVQTYKNARAAGITNIDMYWFPCNGSGNSCKSYATQISEIAAVFSANSMNIGTIWIDIEQDSTCDNWNYGTSGNLAQAKSMISAIKASGFNFGIYSSPGEWGNIFGSTSVVLDSSAPLWFANWNNIETLTLSTKFGGWTTAVGHQYTDVSASGLFDLNVFATKKVLRVKG